ncbi:hypothetical protein K469DRAFT_749350 [Zopfia rhizophila CBS 207.26]|uniref:Uncharacterized protein n=1 Tax=Zopfia rhizophila CBS 207.26 TaxID=1314779 RepID=A0A6A6E4U6_9PEZI|nr:hypothetical protein K469DRAFT_749350 [Zopfia rhizophila CBS 207.26]
MSLEYHMMDSISGDLYGQVVWKSVECGTACNAERPGDGEHVYYCGNGNFYCEEEGCCEDDSISKVDLGEPKIYATVGVYNSSSSSSTASPPISRGSQPTVVVAMGSQSRRELVYLWAYWLLRLWWVGCGGGKEDKTFLRGKSTLKSLSWLNQKVINKHDHQT